MKKFRQGQPMKHASGKQRLHLRLLKKTTDLKQNFLDILYCMFTLGDIKLSLLRVGKFCKASFCRVEDRLLLVLKDKNVKYW